MNAQTPSDRPMEPPEVNAPKGLERPMNPPEESAPSGAERPMDPPKVLRLASLAREVLEEARRMDPQSSTAKELAGLYVRVQHQLKDALPETLAKELEEIELDLPFRDDATGEEVRVVYSALIGWLGGLFQGLQASLLIPQQAMQLNPAEGPGPDGRSLPRPPQGGPPPAPNQAKGEGYL